MTTLDPVGPWPSRPVPSRPGAGRPVSRAGPTGRPVACALTGSADPVQSSEPVAPRRAPVRLTRRGRVVALACALLLAGSLALLVVAAFAVPAAGSGTPPARSGLVGSGVAEPAAAGSGVARAEALEGPATVAVVRPGDTLWSVAARHAPSRDAYRTIEEIRRLNGLEGHTIHPGQELILPPRR